MLSSQARCNLTQQSVASCTKSHRPANDIISFTYNRVSDDVVYSHVL